MKTYRNRNMMAGKMAALLASLLFFSCNNDEILEKGNMGDGCDNICFGISSDEKVQTRGGTAAGKDGYTAGRFVLRSDNSGDTLCVRTVVSDGINVSSFAGETPVTRSAPITSLDTYGAFHVLAYWTKGGSLVESQFYMDEDVTDKGGNRWSSENVYYWPGAEHALQFYAWAPVDAGFSSIPEAPTNDPILGYTVPADMANQKDIVVASPAETAGDHNAAQPLTFRHICTAVKFAVGNQMQPGTIKSVALKGVYTSGTYNMSTDGWSLENTTGDFTQTLDKTMNGTEAAGTEITTAEQTFMMLPQEQLPEGATVVVVFADNTTGTERTLTAPIAGTEWPQGKTVTYRLSITPEYEFKLSDERILDAHYEIFLTNLVVSDMPAGKGWTITASDGVTIQAQSSMNDWAKQGYWTDRNKEAAASGSLTDRGSARGETSYSGTGSGEFPVAIFVPENIGNDKRSIALSLTVDGNIVQTINIEQYAPSWYGSIGCERIEGGLQPWGFYWSNDYAITFDLRSCNENDRESLRQYVEWTQTLHDLSESLLIGWLIRLIFGNDIPDLSFIDMEKSGGFLGLGGIADEITINLGSLNTDNIAESLNDGQQNTRDIYNFQGIQLVNEIINRIQNVGGYNSNMMTETGTGVFPTNNAAIACMKLNSWNVVTAQNEEILQLSDNSPVPDWYLPASGEIAGIRDEEYPLSGEYWTSTSVEDSHENAYKYNANGDISQERRDRNLHVRAVRRR